MEMQKIIKTTDKIFADILADWHKQYGPVFKVQAVNRMIVSTIDQETIKQILVIKNEPKEPFFSGIIGFPFNTRSALDIEIALVLIKK